MEALATPNVILVLLDHPAAADGLLNAASCLADLVGGAHIEVLVARTPPASTIMPSEEILTHSMEVRLRALEDARAAALKAIFDAWNVAATGPRHAADWFDIEAVAVGPIVEWGRRADLIVMERPARRDYGATWQALSVALFETDRPVLVVPPGLTASFGRHVGIAWRDDPHATRAVLSALHFIARASSVHLFAGMRPGSPKPVAPDILTEHGVAVDLQIVPIGEEPFGSALLTKAREVGCDMLVMGAYAHNPWRELILGGATRYVLGHSDLPVLMRH